VAEVEGAEEQGDGLAGDFVDDDELRVFAGGFAGDDGAAGMPRMRAKPMRAARAKRSACGLGWMSQA